MKTLRSSFWVVLLLCPVMKGTPLLQLIPSGGALSGAPGAMVGWGFTITNTTNFL